MNRFEVLIAILTSSIIQSYTSHQVVLTPCNHFHLSFPQRYGHKQTLTGDPAICGLKADLWVQVIIIDKKYCFGQFKHVMGFTGTKTNCKWRQPLKNHLRGFIILLSQITWFSEDNYLNLQTGRDFIFADKSSNATVQLHLSCDGHLVQLQFAHISEARNGGLTRVGGSAVGSIKSPIPLSL